MSENNQKPYPVMVSIDYPERSSRWLALATILMFIKPLLLIPHFIVLYVFSAVSFIAVVAAQFAILFGGKFPKPLFMINKSMMIWSNRMNAYIFGMTDQYPPFDMGLNESDKNEAKKALAWIIGIVVGLIVIAIILVSAQQ